LHILPLILALLVLRRLRGLRGGIADLRQLYPAHVVVALVRPLQLHVVFVEAENGVCLAIVRESQVNPWQGQVVERLHESGRLVLASFGFRLLFLWRLFNLLLQGVWVGEDHAGYQVPRLLFQIQHVVECLLDFHGLLYLTLLPYCDIPLIRVEWPVVSES
jgi:hypothetical protein